MIDGDTTTKEGDVVVKNASKPSQPLIMVLLSTTSDNDSSRSTL
jgi:hypothetical protein